MTFKEVQELIRQLDKSNLSEFKLKEGEFEITIRTAKYAESRGTKYVQSSSVMSNAPAYNPASQPKVDSIESKSSSVDISAAAPISTAGLLEIKAPMVGTFYRSSSPDKPPFVKVGDTVDKGSPVCIVEAMKLFNEIESDVKGKIVKVCVEDASPIEYDQVLFLVEPA
ncbi:MAG: acetyl-CoA carboxylase biotin carboxyl carrier protein [Saprospiraceae bacterium]|nr:acetyl-CoA carboxylase biotin carboxyl carrier protein [Saprospiraceae bacterium]